MLTLLFTLLFSTSYLDTTWSYAGMPHQVPLNNRIWVKVSGLVSNDMKKLQDSLKCSDIYCSDKRPQVFSESDIQRTKTLDSLIFGRICGSTFHLATLKDFQESNKLFRYIDLWRSAMEQGSAPTSNSVFQVFWNERRNELRYYMSAYIGQLITKNDMNNDTGFSVYHLTTKTDDPHWIIASPQWGTNATYNAVCVSDFLLDSSQVVRDTFRIVDTVKKQDTIQTRIVDTVKIQIRDTVLVRDTISIQKTIRDTVRIEKWYIDTVYRIDTVRVKDTVNISTCRDNIYSEVLWKSTGTRNNTSLTIGNESSDQSSIQIKTDERVSVEAYVYDNLGTFASHRTFEIENSPNGKYISFGGYADNGTRCADGIYLIRIVVKGNGFNRNTVYKVGLRG